MISTNESLTEALKESVAKYDTSDEKSRSAAFGELERSFKPVSCIFNKNCRELDALATTAKTANFQRWLCWWEANNAKMKARRLESLQSELSSKLSRIRSGLYSELEISEMRDQLQRCQVSLAQTNSLIDDVVASCQDDAPELRSEVEDTAADSSSERSTVEGAEDNGPLRRIGANNMFALGHQANLGGDTLVDIEFA